MKNSRCGKYHHLVWSLTPAGVAHACAHCWFKGSGHQDAARESFQELQAVRSQDAHDQQCGGRFIGQSFSDAAKWRLP